MSLLAKSCFVKLSNRGLIQIEGEDRYDFLQNLISNDMALLPQNRMIYACLLTPQGKFLHDFFIIDAGTVLLIDCEGGERAQDLYKRLNMYRLRSKIQISVENNHPVYAVFGNPIGHADPRHPDMGYRSFEKPDDLDEISFDEWDKHRTSLCVPDGSRDMIPERSTLLECHIDKLNGVSFTKGCFVGQEVTARMHHRGLVKKHLRTVDISALPEKAELRSSCGDIGLAMVRD